MYMVKLKEKTIIPIKNLNTLCNYFNVTLDYIFNFTKVKNNNSRKNININLSAQRLRDLEKKIN